MKWLKRILLATLGFFLALGIGGYLFFKSTLPVMDGELRLQGLSEPVTIHRDTYGIPHIQATNNLDAYRALGFFMASERLFQLELSRRLTQGRLSELFGEVALPSDKLYRSLMLRKATERMLDDEKKRGAYDPALWAELEAYFAGVNEYVRTQPLPAELRILRLTPEPFTPLDGFIMAGHMAYSFGIALKTDPLMTELAKQWPGEQFQGLRSDRLKFATPSSTAALFRPFKLLPWEGLFAPTLDGSNAWLIAPSRSESGKSLFANDPHIAFSSPAVWTEAHIKTPDFEIYGHYLPLIPFAVLGHNHRQAWGFTMSLTDDMDLYRERLDRNKKTVLFKGEPIPYQQWEEIIQVKNAEPVSFDLIETPHGPLLNEVLAEKDLALKWAYHQPHNNPLKALRLMGLSTSLKEFEHALQKATAPGLNVMYADADNIAWWILGDIAVKANPNSDMIFDGASGKDEYVRVLRWDEKPHQINPPSGIILTANSRPQTLDDTIRGDWQPDDRFQTLSTILHAEDLWAAEDFKELQNRNYNQKTKDILNRLLEALRLSDEDARKYQDILEDLRRWDLRSDIDSTAASVFHLWNNANIHLILADLDPDKKEAYLATPFSWAFYQRVLFETNSPWLQKRDLSATVTAGFLEVMTKHPTVPTWGELHTIEYRHPLGRIFPLNWIFNLGPYPIGGNYNEIPNNKSRYFGSSSFEVFAGASTRRIIDFAKPETSWGINPIGTSAHLLSPYFKDQVDLFLKGEYREQLLADEDILKSRRHTLVLRPEK